MVIIIIMQRLTRCVSVVRMTNRRQHIMRILGVKRNQMAAVYLSKWYCLPSLLCNCETWYIRPHELRSESVAWNNSFRKIFDACWRKSVKPLQSFCVCQYFLIHQRRIIYWKKRAMFDNNILQTLAKLCLENIAASYNLTVKDIILYLFICLYLD